MLSCRPVRAGSALMRSLLAIALVGGLLVAAPPAHAATIQVPADHDTIQAAIDAAIAGDVIQVAAGNYPENLVLNKSVTLEGAQAGVDARGRVAAESIIDPGAGVLLTLQTGSAGASIDGFTFSGGATAIVSGSGPIDDLTVTNNRILGFTGTGLFLNDKGSDITVSRNAIDGTAKAGGGMIHLDFDAFDGFHLVDNDIVNGAAGTGLFSDGARNVGVSATRSPLIQGNLFESNGTAANLGRKSLEFAAITNNVFRDNAFDGLQGGPADSTIQSNVFDGNGRSGIALTGFGTPTDATRGAQRNDIRNNFFTGNLSEALFFSPTQAAGTIATNAASNNCITGNAAGAVYSGTETIDVENNWWGATDGPSGAYPGSGDSVSSLNLDADPFLVSPPAECPDTAGPVTSDVAPTTAQLNVAVLLTAVVDDTTTGGSTVASAEYSVNGGPWTPMAATDNAFDEVSEDVQAQIGPFAAPQELEVCVRGTDEHGNTGAAECVLLVVGAADSTPDPGVNAPPTIQCPAAWAVPVIAKAPSTLEVTANDPSGGNVKFSGSGPASLSPSGPVPVPAAGMLSFSPTLLDYLLDFLPHDFFIPGLPDQQVTVTDPDGLAATCTIVIDVVLFHGWPISPLD